MHNTILQRQRVLGKVISKLNVKIINLEKMKQGKYQPSLPPPPLKTSESSSLHPLLCSPTQNPIGQPMMDES